MATQDICVTIGPYFRVKSGKLHEFKKLCERLSEHTNKEQGCLYYGFAFEGDLVFCREGWVDAQALLAHSKSVAQLIEEALTIATLERCEIHGPESELAQLRGPMAGLKPQLFVLEYGFRR